MIDRIIRETSIFNMKDVLVKSIAMVLLLMPVTVSAQKGMFLDAMKEARKPGLAYQAKEQVSGPMVSDTHKRIVAFCNDKGYKIINSVELPVASNGSAYRQYLLVYDFVPASEYEQYEKEVNTLKNGGMLDYTHCLPVYPTDEKSKKQADKLYEKAQRQRLWDLYHEAAQLGHVQAKVKEAQIYMRLKSYNQFRAMAYQVVNELILLENPDIWKATYDIMSNDGKAYVDWRNGVTKDVPFRFLWQYKGKEIAEQKLREGAEAGIESAQKELGKQLWHGGYLAQDKKEAIKWILPFAENDHTLRDYVFVAKGEGVYNGDIKADWYNYHPSRLVIEAAENGNMEAKMLLSYRGDMKLIKTEVEKGNGKAAEFLDAYIRGRAYVMENEMLLLLKNASKTKYDKYGADCKLINEMYQDAVQYHKSGKTDRFNDRSKFAQTFVSFYTKYPQYDKNRMVKKAKLLSEFCKVNDVLCWREDPQLWEYKRRGFMDREPVRNEGAEARYFADMDNAVATCNRLKNDPTLGQYFAKSITLLNQKKARVKEFVKSDNEVFNRESREYLREQENRRIAREDTERANSVKVPSIRKVEEGNHGRFFDSDDNYDDTDYYIFSDGARITVHHRYRDGDINYYYAERIGQSAKYITAKDAADAGWVYEKLKVVRSIGKID